MTPLQASAQAGRSLATAGLSPRLSLKTIVQPTIPASDRCGTSCFRLAGGSGSPSASASRSSLVRSSEGLMAMAGNPKAQPKKVGGWFYRKLPWYGKILVPVAVLVAILYAVEWVAGLFV